MAVWLACCVSAAATLFIPEGKTDESYLEELIERKENGEILAGGEEKVFCILMAVLKDSIILDCLPALEGINWEKPPISPEALGEDWEEITTLEQAENSHRRMFRHKKYGKIEIAFDKGESDLPYKGPKAHAREDHWHRLNPNSSENPDYYLDGKGKPVEKKSDESHLKIKRKK